MNYTTLQNFLKNFLQYFVTFYYGLQQLEQ